MVPAGVEIDEDFADEDPDKTVWLENPVWENEECTNKENSASHW